MSRLRVSTYPHILTILLLTSTTSHARATDYETTSTLARRPDGRFRRRSDRRRRV